MAEPTITCPACGTAIPLTQSLAAPLLAQERKAIAAREAALEATLAERVAAEQARLAEAAEAAAREAAAARLAELEAALASREATLAEALAAQAEALRKAQEGAAARLAELEAALASREAKLAEAQAAQAEALRKTREIEEARRELDLTVEKRVAEALGQVRETARAEAEEALRLKVAERDQVIAGMQRTIEELKRRSEQGSQQLQGEVLELDLEAALAARFPSDAIEPIGKGVAGADLIQRVRGPGGVQAGVILWEIKRTKAWNAEWLVKLRADQRALGAEVALILSEALPKGVEGFDLVDGVWVAPPRLAMPLATVLRATLTDLAKERAARAGQGTKMELVYDYLTGPRFRHRVGAIVEKFQAMEEDLRTERARTLKAWARREAQIQGVVEATMGMYGDLQGIAGKALGEIEGLEPPLLDGPEG